ncbi:hypothetical protein LCGC14_2595990 [marine sediment metagenome]|uniref:ATP-dependent DNA ligase family profile domain-containing protein n=1 Tax=marine sediment metagenome TaxID=412755 RepID=A0A0F9D2W4_9ZZZZ
MDKIDKQIDYEHACYSQTKFDGFRIILEQQGDKISLFTEDRFRDRAEILPQVVKEIKDNIKVNFIADSEIVQWIDGKPVPRESAMWLIVGKTPMSDDIELHLNVHDCLFFDEEAINILPYHERLEFLDKLLPKDLKYLKKAKSCLATDRKSFDKCLKEAYAYPGSEGALVKYASSIYDISKPRTPEWAKIKKVHQISTEIIGLQRKALPFSSIGMKTPTSNIEGEEALSTYKKLTEKSSTFIARCALRDNSKLVPLDSKKRLTESDFNVKWNATLSKPKWQGLDNKSLWKMNKDIDDRQAGDQAFGNTYAFSFKDKEPKVGDVISVVPVQLVEFTKDDETHISWMFPKVISPEPEKNKADDIKDIQPMIRKE